MLARDLFEILSHDIQAMVFSQNVNVVPRGCDLFVWHHESGLLAKSATQSTHLSCTVVSLCVHDLKPSLNLDRFCCRVLSSAEHLFITDRTHLGSGLGIVYCMGRDVNNHCNIDGQKTLAGWLVICDRSDILWKRTKFWLLQLSVSALLCSRQTIMA